MRKMIKVVRACVCVCKREREERRKEGGGRRGASLPSFLPSLPFPPFFPYLSAIVLQLLGISFAVLFSDDHGRRERGESQNFGNLIAEQSR